MQNTFDCLLKLTITALATMIFIKRREVFPHITRF